jgi:hypothetical protein
MSLSRQQYTLLGIFALFLGPVLLVILMRSSWWQYQPAGLKNHGTLVQPPLQLTLNQTEGFNGKWLLLQVIDQPCEQECTEAVTALRQVYRATGRKAEHLAIVLLSDTPLETALRTRLESIYPDYNFVADTSGTAIKTLTSVNSAVKTATSDSNEIHTYILDPMLNVILAYQVDANPGDIHKDLKRLLKWSDQENR